MLLAERLTKHFGAVRAVEGLDLQVGPGDVLCLLGANGAGKTTTIHLFLGFLTPDAGSVTVDGVAPAKSPLEARRRLAYISESVALYPDLTGIENLAFFDRLTGRQRSRSELSGLLNEAGLPSEAHGRRASTYSKGMRQKVGLAVAFARETQALLLDEPLSGLDPYAANEFCAAIQGLKGRGCAVLLATHDLFRAKEIGTRIGIMKGGRLVELLDPRRLDSAEIERIYVAHMHDGGEAAA